MIREMRQAFTKSEDPSQALVESRAILERYGHLKPGTELSLNLHDAIFKGRVPPALLQEVCTELTEHSHPKHATTALHIAMNYGLRNLSKTEIPSEFYASGNNLQGFNFSGARFKECTFSNCDLRDADFTDAHFDGMQESVVFRGSNLAGAKFPRIFVRGEHIDLLEDAIHLQGPSLWDTERPAYTTIGICGDCERFHRKILSRSTSVSGKLIREERPESRSGVLLFQEGRPIGYMKASVVGYEAHDVGLPNFVALRTVYDAAGNILFRKGMVYGLQRDVQQMLHATAWNLKTPALRTWLRVDVETLAKKWQSEKGQDGLQKAELRFLTDSHLYAELGNLAREIEKGETEFITLDI